MSAHSSWRCCTAGSMRCPRAERPFARPRRAELLTVRLRRSARALAVVDVCDYDPGCGHGALSPCLQAVRRSRAGRHLLVLGLRPGSAGPGRLGLEVETAPAKIFGYTLVSSSSRGCLSAAADVAVSSVSADGPIPSSRLLKKSSRTVSALNRRDCGSREPLCFQGVLVAPQCSKRSVSAPSGFFSTLLAPPYPVRGRLRGLPWQSPVPVRAGRALRSHPRDAAPLTWPGASNGRIRM